MLIRMKYRTQKTFLDLISASICLIGQGCNRLAYERRLMILSAITTVEKAKRALSDGESKISDEESTFLFGSKFV